MNKCPKCGNLIPVNQTECFNCKHSNDNFDFRRIIRSFIRIIKGIVITILSGLLMLSFALEFYSESLYSETTEGIFAGYVNCEFDKCDAKYKYIVLGVKYSIVDENYNLNDSTNNVVISYNPDNPSEAIVGENDYSFSTSKKISIILLFMTIMFVGILTIFNKKINILKFILNKVKKNNN